MHSSSFRTDQNFIDQSDSNYHTGITILTTIPNLRQVSNVSLDYMHLICLGVVKKLLFIWKTGPLKNRLSAFQIQRISNRLINLKGTTPKEFMRKPRGIDELKFWKATEFRQFLLYTGPVVLKSLLPENMYIHFLMLRYT